MLKITNTLLKQSAEARGWRVEILSEAAGILRYSLPNGRRVVLQSTLSPFTSAISVEIANDKFTTFLLAQETAVPVAMTHRVKDEDEVIGLLDKYGEIIIKPAGGAHGNGVSTQLTTPNQVKSAYKHASSFKSIVIVQPQLHGKDVRVVIIGSKLAAAAIRHPASVMGDGIKSLRELIQTENSSDHRSDGYYKALNHINITAAEMHLGQKIDETSVEGQKYVVVGAANIGLGGTSEDITDAIGSEIVADSIKILRAAGMETGAADFIVNDDSHTLLEINANPSFGLHTYPSIGKSQNVSDQYLDWIESKLN